MAPRRGLTPEDRELWLRVTRTATPLEPKRRAALPDYSPSAKPAPKAAAPDTARPLSPDFAIGTRPRRLPGHDLAPSPAEALANQPIRMDH